MNYHGRQLARDRHVFLWKEMRSGPTLDGNICINVFICIDSGFLSFTPLWGILLHCPAFHP